MSRIARSGPGASAATAVLLALAAVLSSAPSAAQSVDAARGVITGAIVDANRGHAIEGATVVLQPDVAGAFPGPAAGTAFVTAGRSVLTDSAGTYRFDGLPPGVYRLYVSRFSYRPYAVSVELRGGGESAVSVGLRAEPIALRPVEGGGLAPSPFRSLDAAGATDENRLLAVSLKRRRFLTTDVRELTDADVSEAVTLGEPDVMRALQRLPGVAAPSDYSAELWTRGGPWSHTRVYYDGVPLFNPLHALGVLSGISSSALGAVWFHPGTRTAGIGEGAAGVVDLQSRRAAGTGTMNIQGDLSLMSAGLALDQRVLDGRAGWMLAGRRTYLDWLSDLAGRATGSDEEFPYGFTELSGMVDARLGAGASLEASGLWEADRITREASPGTDPLHSDWGNALGRVSVAARLPGEAGLRVRNTLAFSATHNQVVVDTGGSAFDSDWRRSWSGVRYGGLSGSVWPAPQSIAGPAWTAGYALEAFAADYDGPMPLGVRADLATGSESGFADRTFWAAWAEELSVAALWGEHTWAPDERVAVRTGLRMEGGTRVKGAGSLRLAPRVGVRYAASPEIALSTGFARVFQYTQALAPGGVHLASLFSGDVWVVAGETVPALRADILTAGMEAWLEPGRVASLNWFGRRTAGVAMLDPRPGPVYGRTTLYAGESLAYGVEASVRQVTGPVTGSLGYTYSRARTTALGLEFASGSDRPHVVDATLMVRALPSLALGAAFTGATGAPFTLVISDSTECLATAGCELTGLPWALEPNEGRAPAFASLDLLADWSITVAGIELGAYAQLRNALGRRNATVYVGGGPGCLPGGCDDDVHNAVERGLPRLAVVGIRVRR